MRLLELNDTISGMRDIDTKIIVYLTLIGKIEEGTKLVKSGLYLSRAGGGT